MLIKCLQLTVQKIVSRHDMICVGNVSVIHNRMHDTLNQLRLIVNKFNIMFYFYFLLFNHLLNLVIHTWCRYCSICWCSWRSIGVKLVGHSMSGCYVPCLPNPDSSSFLPLVGFIGIIFGALLIIMRLLFHIKQPMNYHQQSPYHHQPFQSIINQQSLPTYLLDAFCNHWDFCSLPRLLQHLDSHQSQSTISSTIQCMNLFWSSPHFHCILEYTSHSLDDTILVYDLGASAGLILFKPGFFNYVKCSIPVCDISKVNEVIGIGTTIHKFVNTKGQFVYLPQVAYHFPSSKVCLFSPEVFHENCGRKSIIFGGQLRFT